MQTNHSEQDTESSHTINSTVLDFKGAQKLHVCSCFLRLKNGGIMHLPFKQIQAMRMPEVSHFIDGRMKKLEMSSLPFKLARK